MAKMTDAQKQACLKYQKSLGQFSIKIPKPKLERIETDVLNNFKTLGVRTEPLSGYERLKVLHDVFIMDTKEFVMKFLARNC